MYKGYSLIRESNIISVMQRVLNTFALSQTSSILLGTIPLAVTLLLWISYLADQSSVQGKSLAFIAIISVICSLLSIVSIKHHRDKIKIHELVVELAESLGHNEHDLNGVSSKKLLRSCIRDGKLRLKALSINKSKNQIKNSRELALALSDIAEAVFLSFKAESIEIALFDEKSGHHHSSLIKGKRFHASAQSAFCENNSEVVISPWLIAHQIKFSNKILGNIRVLLEYGRPPTAEQKQLLSFFSNQAAIAILNCNYTAEIQRMQQFSEENIKAKTGFLANLSHELRGPLALMVNGVELVKDGLCGEVNSEQLEMLQMVYNNSDYLLDLMNDVLDYSKAECGKTKPNFEAIPLSPLLKDMHGVIRASAEAKEQKLRFKFPENLAIEADKRHIRQILINILTNAVKYTPEGGQIEVWTTEHRDKITIHCRDTGVGIAAHNKSKVFAAFERVDEGYSNQQLGTGLGMSLTSTLVDLNKGHIDFESAYGKGSHFWVTFNKIEYNEKESSKKKKKNKVRHASGEQILFFGKDLEEYRVLGKYLPSIGYKCKRVIDTYELKTIITDTTVVIVDESTRRENIAEVVRETRLSKNPVIVLASDAFQVDIENYLKMGVDRCLIKPIDLREAAIAIQKILPKMITLSNAQH